MLRLMGYIAAKVPPDNAVPSWVLPYYLLDESSNILLNVVFLQGLSGTLHRVLLHLLRHVGIFDHSLSFRHGCLGIPKQSGKFIIFKADCQVHNDFRSASNLCP
uniref:Uncharacterized protein n=1 Tax=Neogobius melanostomus TaxID=47308 RepID=A0A8C6SWN0_9GOBI